MIKLIDIDDLTSIAEYEKYFIHSDSYSLKTLSSMFQNKNYLFYGYFQNNILVGYLIASINGLDLELLKIFTSETFRRRQIGSQLLNHLINHHPNSIFTEVNTKNTTAIEFYLKNMFTKLNIRKNYYGLGEDAYILVRNI